MSAPFRFIPTPMSDISLVPTGGIGLLGMIGAGAAAYHGYKRNRSVGWALAWGAAGAFAPIITNAIGLAQGFTRYKGDPR